jgi:glycosyltransferase involved in cell wall biosynthesis
MSLSILIPTIKTREHLLRRLLNILEPQAKEFGHTIHVLPGEKKTIGAKRNELVSMVKTPYAVFIDDDDTVSPNYCKLIQEGIDMNVDVVGIRGKLFVNGVYRDDFEHSINCPNYLTRKVNRKHSIHYRQPNHLNPMRTAFFLAFPFKQLNHAEDYDFCLRLHDSGVLMTEHMIEEPIYNYLFIPNKD